MKKISKKEQEGKYINLLTSERVNEILEKENQSLKLAKHEHIWFDKQIGVRRAGLKFAMTKVEIEEYIKCKMNVHYFADNYCQIKREDGSVGKMTLRDYQKDIIDLYSNRYSILMASRQVGKCVSLASKITISDINDVIRDISLGELYYSIIKQERKLTILEAIKYRLYKILSHL